MPRSSIESPALTDLRANLYGRALFEGDARYEAERAPWNLNVDHRPRVVVAAARPDDVATAIRYARAEGLPIAVQATGHGQATEAHDAVLVSTRGLLGVDVDVTARTARISAGEQWRHVIDRTGPHGLAPLNGSTSRVGVIGYLTGGGLPVFGRRYGFAAEHVRTVELVTADGRRRRTSRTDEPDLFWAVRGGGSNFGVVTAVEIGLVRQPRFYGGGLYFPATRAADVLRHWKHWTDDLPDAMCSSVALIRYPDDASLPSSLRGRFLVHLRIGHTGHARAGARLVRPLRALGPLLDDVRERPITEIDEIHRDPPGPVAAAEAATMLHTVDDAFVDRLLTVAGVAAQAPPDVVEVRHLGGALTTPSASALGRRDATFNLFFGALRAPAARAHADLNRALDAIEPWSTGSILPTFLGGSGHTDPTRVRSAYSPADHARLQRIKQRYDPTNLFRLNHNIVPA